MPNHNQLSLVEAPHVAQARLGHLLVDAVAEANETVKTQEYQIFVNPNERMEYMHLTDDLITTIDGTAEDLPKPYDAVIYLDSSARPVNWMVRGLWDFAAKRDEQGNPVPQPPIFFANIDARRVGRNVDSRRIEELRKTFPSLIAMNDSEESKRILIVDEIAVSGDTLDMAEGLLSQAFPNLEFKGYAWKDERSVPEMSRDNVRWYERGNDRLRAVLDESELSAQQRAQLAAREIVPKTGWLSMPNPDRSGADKLKAEVERMLDELKAGDLPYWPSNNRSIENVEDLVASHDDKLTLQDFRLFREWMKRHYSPSPAANLITTDKNGPLTEREASRYLSNRQLLAPRPVLNDTVKTYIQKLGYMKA